MRAADSVEEGSFVCAHTAPVPPMLAAAVPVALLSEETARLLSALSLLAAPLIVPSPVSSWRLFVSGITLPPLPLLLRNPRKHERRLTAFYITGALAAIIFLEHQRQT